jgi:hypothetical protein
MKRLTWILPMVLLVAFGRPAWAQTGRPLQQRTISEALDSRITNTETHVVPVADAMPENRYSFAPPPTSGEFKGVRTFAQQVKHLAANNYWMAALMLGDEPTPEMSEETGPDSVRTKTQIIDPPAGGQKTRLSLAVDAVAHSFDHYGQLVEYLCRNGIVPPDSRPRTP